MITPNSPQSPDIPLHNMIAVGPLVLFDGVCNLCSWSVQFLARRNAKGGLRFSSVQSPLGEALLRHYGLTTGDYDSFVFIDEGRSYEKSEAFFRVVRHMAWPWPLLRIFGVLPSSITDWVYDRVAKNRFAMFGKNAVCMVPSAEVRARFLN